MLAPGILMDSCPCRGRTVLSACTAGCLLLTLTSGPQRSCVSTSRGRGEFPPLSERPPTPVARYCYWPYARVADFPVVTGVTAQDPTGPSAVGMYSRTIGKCWFGVRCAGLSHNGEIVFILPARNVSRSQGEKSVFEEVEPWGSRMESGGRGIGGTFGPGWGNLTVAQPDVIIPLLHGHKHPRCAMYHGPALTRWRVSPHRPAGSPSFTNPGLNAIRTGLIVGML